MARRKFVFEQIQLFIKNGDYTCINHIMKWEYQKDRMFRMKNDDGLTLVHTACLDGKFKCLEVLLNHGGNVHTKSSVGWSALHAATLGGHLSIVSYLLRECSADPLAKDDMGCVASDLTMDKDIASILQKYAAEATLRRDIEALASTVSIKDKRRTYSCNEMSRKNKKAIRARSMFCNEEEALQIRSQYSTKSKDDVTTRKYSDCPASERGTGDITNALRNLSIENTQGRDMNNNNSSASDAYIADSEGKLSEEVIRKKSSSFSQVSGASPREVKFYTLNRNRKKRETRNRDSGVYDDEESESSDTSQTRKEIAQNHFKII